MSAGSRFPVGGPAFFLVLFVGSAAWVLARAADVPGPAGTDPEVFPPGVLGDLPGFRTDTGYLPDDERLGFVRIPSGPFLMGSDPSIDPLAFDNEPWAGTGGPGAVELPDFYIGRFPVTVAQYRAFVVATGHPTDPAALEAPPDHPVTSVSWADAVAYARWLEGALKASSATPPELSRHLADGWRILLPSEAEWEKAARGTDGRIFPWGDEPRRDRANFLARGTTPVGRFPCPECPFGISDMSGNVWEWTRTPFRPGPYEPDPPALDLREDALWVMRGGSFGDPVQNIRAAVRGGGDPGARRPFIGFRIALVPPMPDRPG